MSASGEAVVLICFFHLLYGGVAAIGDRWLSRHSSGLLAVLGPAICLFVSVLLARVAISVELGLVVLILALHVLLAVFSFPSTFLVVLLFVFAAAALVLSAIFATALSMLSFRVIVLAELQGVDLHGIIFSKSATVIYALSLNQRLEGDLQRCVRRSIARVARCYGCTERAWCRRYYYRNLRLVRQKLA